MFGVVTGNLKHGVHSVSNTLRIFAREELNNFKNWHFSATWAIYGLLLFLVLQADFNCEFSSSFN